VRDRVINDGFRPEGLCLLYHCNFGWPVVSESSVVRAPSSTCTPRNEEAARGIENWSRLEAPRPEAKEQVFFHNLDADESGFVRYDTRELPFFTQWKCMASGTYVCGLEPSNAALAPRDELRRRGDLPMLEPGEAREFGVELGALL
jgi:hypothetical protein